MHRNGGGSIVLSRLGFLWQNSWAYSFSAIRCRFFAYAGSQSRESGLKMKKLVGLLVLVVGVASGQTVSTTVGVGSRPSGVAVNPAGTRAYVTNYYGNSVSVIDTATNLVTATVAVGSGPVGVAVNPAGTRAYVTNNNGGNSV